MDRNNSRCGNACFGDNRIHNRKDCAKMNITPVKIYYIEPDKLYAYMVGVVTIYSKYPQITPEIREQIEMDIAETIPDIVYDYHYTNGECLPPVNQKIYGMSTQQYTLTYIANWILGELTPD